MRKMNKKAISHIEVILSFVIFTGFLIFMLAIFKPFKSENSDRASLDLIERGLKEKVEVSVKFFTIKLNLPISCFTFNHSFENISAKDEFGPVNAVSGITNGESSIAVSGTGLFYYIYSSTEFIEKIFDSSSCERLVKGEDFEMGLSRKFNFYSNNSIYLLQQRFFNGDYEIVKDELNLDSSKEFSFSVRQIDGTVIIDAFKNPLGSTKVESRNVPIQIVYGTGEFKTAVLNIKSW